MTAALPFEMVAGVAVTLALGSVVVSVIVGLLLADRMAEAGLVLLAVALAPLVAVTLP